MPVEGTRFGGSTQIYHMDVDPAGTKLVMIGNFAPVGGQPRTEVAMVDLTSGAVSNWEHSAGSVSGHVRLLMTDSNGPVPVGTAGGLTVPAGSATTNATMATIKIPRRRAGCSTAPTRTPAPSLISTCHAA